MKKAKHSPAQPWGSRANGCIFSEREKALYGPSWGAARPGPCRAGAGKLTSGQASETLKRGRTHPPLPTTQVSLLT